MIGQDIELLSFIEIANIRKNLSIEDYIYLFNIYSDIHKNLDNLYKERENIAITLATLKAYNLIPDESNEKYLSLRTRLNEISHELQIIDEISCITSIENLRYFIGNIQEKENISFEEMSIKAGCEPKTLYNLVSNTYSISENELNKIINYYGMNAILPSWKRRYVSDYCNV